MDGRGRVFDNIFIERLWRTVKYEHIYLYAYQTGLELQTVCLLILPSTTTIGSIMP